MARAKKAPASRWLTGDTALEDLAADEQLAHGLVTDFGYLTPSVERIMDSELPAAGREHALAAFRESLSNIDDPNRDPAVAIENAAGVS